MRSVPKWVWQPVSPTLPLSSLGKLTENVVADLHRMMEHCSSKKSRLQLTPEVVLRVLQYQSQWLRALNVLC